jgi:hypothetical protein
VTRSASAPAHIISLPALRLTGAVLLLALALAYLAPLVRRNGRAEYLDVALGAVSLGALVAAGALTIRGSWRDWRAAEAVAAAAAVGYVISRGIGWPGASADVNRWSSAAGSAALATAITTFAVAAAGLKRLAADTRPGRPPGRDHPAPDPAVARRPTSTSGALHPRKGRSA